MADPTNLNEFLAKYGGLPFSSLDFDGAKHKKATTEAMLLHLGQMFSTNWRFDGDAEFKPLTQRLFLLGYALHGLVGIYRTKAGRRLPVIVVQQKVDYETGEIIQAHGFPLHIWLGKAGFPSKETDQGWTELLTEDNCAFLLPPFGIDSLTKKVKPWVEKTGILEAISLSNALTTQNKYTLETNSAIAAETIKTQLLAVGEPVVATDSRPDKVPSESAKERFLSRGMTDIKPIPFAVSSLSEISSLLKETKATINELYGIRQNTNFKKERNISNEYDQEEIRQTQTEEIIQPQLDAFAESYAKVFGHKITLMDQLAETQAEVEGEQADKAVEADSAKKRTEAKSEAAVLN